MNFKEIYEKSIKKPDEFLKAYFYLEKAKSNGSTYSQELNAHN